MLNALLGVIFGLTFLGSKITLEYLHPMQTLACRWTAALVFFCLLAGFKVVKLNFKGKPLRNVIGVAAIQPCAYAIFEIFGINRVSTSETSIIMAMSPIVVAILSVALFRTKVSRPMVGAIVLSFTGVVIMIGGSGGFAIGGKAAGYLFLMGALLTGGFYILTSGRAASRFTPQEITFVMAVMGALFFNILALSQGYGFGGFRECFLHGKLIVAILFLGVLCSGICFLIMNYVISKLPGAQVAAIQVNITVVTGVLAGAIFQKEAVGWYTVVGLILIMIGVVAASRQSPNTEIKEEEAMEPATEDVL